MKNVYIISGLDTQHTAVDSVYSDLCEAIKAKGYKVIASNISWKHMTPDQYANSFINLYNKSKSKTYNVVIGNSFGAVVAFITAAEINPNLVLICSLSPFFKEDITKNWPPKTYNKLIGKRRLDELGKCSVHAIAKKINQLNIEFKVLYGEKEHQSSHRLVKRCQNITHLLNNAPLIEVPNAPHEFSDHHYIQGIITAL